MSWIWASCRSKLRFKSQLVTITTVKFPPAPLSSPLFANRRKANGVTGLLPSQNVPSATGACLACEVKVVPCVALPHFLPEPVTLGSVMISFPSARLTCTSFNERTGRGFGAGRGVVWFLVCFLSFELLSFQLEEEINIVSARKMHKITPTAENLPPPAGEVGLLGRCSLGYINSYHTWLTHTATGQHIAGWQDKVKFNYCYFHDGWGFSCINSKKLDETAITVSERGRNWKRRSVAFSCEEQSVSSKVFFLSQRSCGALSVT